MKNEMLWCAMKRVSLSFGSFRWRAPGKHSNKGSRWKAFRGEPSSAWAYILVAMVSRPETEEIPVCFNARKAARRNRACIAIRSKAVNPSGLGYYRKRPTSHPGSTCIRHLNLLSTTEAYHLPLRRLDEITDPPFVTSFCDGSLCSK